MLMFSKDTQKQKIIFNMGIFHILTNNILIKDDTLFDITTVRWGSLEPTYPMVLVHCTGSDHKGSSAANSTPRNLYIVAAVTIVFYRTPRQ